VSGRVRLTVVIRYSVTIVIALFFIFPLYWTLVTSLKTYREAFQIPPIFLKIPDFRTYIEYFGQSDFLRYLSNSLIVTTVSVVIGMASGVPAAYALSRIRIPGGEAVSFYLLASRFIPPISTVISVFFIFRRIGLYDTLLGLIILYLSMNIPYVVWMMRGFFKEIPVAVEESAWIDGCSRFRGFVQIVLPMSRPGLAATAVLTMMFSWNEFLFALIITGARAKTLPLSIAAFMGEVGIEWNAMAAAGMMIMLPAMVFSILMQRQLARGLTFGALKG
jgi:multiple sugar transport system permease protein